MTNLQPSGSKLNIILVHGVWTDGSIWRGVLSALATSGHNVLAAQLPLTSFDGDLAALERLLDHVVGPVILVGHSYGGAVITAAGSHEKVRQLIYVAALAPDKGETFGDLFSIYPSRHTSEMGPDQHGFVWATRESFEDTLGYDLPKPTVTQLTAVQKPYMHRLFQNALGTPAWHKKPTSYLITTEDRVLAPKTQHMLAERISAEPVHELASGHLPMVRSPEAVAQFILASIAAL